MSDGEISTLNELILQEPVSAEGGSIASSALDIDAFLIQVCKTIQRICLNNGLIVEWSRCSETSRYLAVDGMALRHLLLSMALTAIAGAGEGVLSLRLETKIQPKRNDRHSDSGPKLRFTMMVPLPILDSSGDHPALEPEVCSFLAQSLGAGCGYGQTPAGELAMWLELAAVPVDVSARTLSERASEAGIAAGTVPPGGLVGAKGDSGSVKGQFDSAILDDLASFLDPPDIEDYIGLLKPTLERRYHDLIAGVAVANWHAGRVAAHALVGAAACYGLIGVAGAARTVESALRNEDPDTLEALTAELCQRIEEAAGLIADWERRRGGAA